MFRRCALCLLVVLFVAAGLLSSAGAAAAFVAAGDGTWWWQNPLPQGVRLLDVDFIDATTGWAVGKSGVILHTTDGGDSWTGQSSGTSWDLTKVSCADAGNAWAIGRSEIYEPDLQSNKVLLRTTDGGLTWVRENLPGSQWPYVLRDVCFVDAQNGWVLGVSDYNAYILHTADGGATWSFQSPEPWASISSISFIDTQHGWVAGGSKAYATTDGGATWANVFEDTDIADHLNTVSARGDSVWLAGQDNTYAARLWLSTDGGQGWTPVASPPNLVSAPSFINEDQGWGISSIQAQGIVHTTDGGASWQSQYAPLYSDYYDFAQLRAQSIAAGDPLHAWTVGAGGTMLRTTDGGTWSPLSMSVASGDLVAADFADSATGWAVGRSFPGGLILHTTDGGLVWTQQDSGTLTALSCVSVVDADEAWIGIEGGDSETGHSLLHTTDGGVTWSSASNGLWFDGTGVTHLQFLDKDRGWEMSAYFGQMARTTDGGASWQELDMGGMHPFDFAFADSMHGWIVGDEAMDIGGNPIGKTAYTTDGGLTWIPDGERRADGEDYMTQLAVADPTHGYACGGHTIWRMTDGVHWQPIDLSAQTESLPAEVATAQFTDIAAIDASRVVAVARDGMVLRTDDGGDTWYVQDAGLHRRDLGPYDPPLLAGITAVDAGRLWAVGARGAILSTWHGFGGTDSTPPTTTMTEGDGEWTSHAVVHLVARDAESGVAGTRYRVDAGVWSPGADIGLDEGDHTIEFASTDNAGNPETPNTATLKVDLTAPSTTAGGVDSEQWYDHDVNVTLDASDALSGVAATRWTYYAGTAQSGTSIHVAAPADSSNDGPHSIWYWSEDVAGNPETPHELWVNIDTWSPTTTTEGDGTLVADETHIAMSAVDDPAAPDLETSGVEATYYSIDGGPELLAEPAVAPLLAAPSLVADASPTCYAVIDPAAQDLSDGPHTVTYRSVDAAGNSEAPKSFSVTVKLGPSGALKTVGHTATNRPIATWVLPGGWTPTLVEVSSEPKVRPTGSFVTSLRRATLAPSSTSWSGDGAPLHPGTYYVHVRFRSLADGTYEWTAIKSFAVAKTAVPVLVKPLTLAKKVVSGRLRLTCRVGVHDDSLGRILVRIVQQRIVGGRVVATATRDVIAKSPLSLGAADRVYAFTWLRPAKLAGKGTLRVTVRVRDQEYLWSAPLRASVSTRF